jgi:CubicO group peptidase (beta-lactamase class C family)
MHHLHVCLTPSDPTQPCGSLCSRAGNTPAAWELANWSLQIPLETAPGEAYAYSNTNYWLLNYILEKVGLI